MFMVADRGFVWMSLYAANGIDPYLGKPQANYFMDFLDLHHPK